MEPQLTPDDPLVEVGKCCDCGSPILMTTSEQEWWKKATTEPPQPGRSKLMFPKRCPLCREKKRKEPDKPKKIRLSPALLQRLLDFLSKLDENAILPNDLEQEQGRLKSELEGLR